MHPIGSPSKTLRGPADRARFGFTLVELLVVIAIIGVLIGLLLPAVQRTREAGRRAACTNNLRQSALAVAGYEANRRRLPPGYDATPAGADLPNGTLHAWSSFVLPFLEEAMSSRIDYRKAWNAAGGNDDVADRKISVYRCPSAVLDYPGKTDFGGISGSWILDLPGGDPPATMMTAGLLVPVKETGDAVRSGSVSDGMSQTLLLGESADRGPAANEPTNDDDPFGRWAVYNCFPQTEAIINTTKSDIRSLHPGGAMVAFGDARVVFLDESTDPVVLSAICSRNGGESAALRQ